jgi:hypothetical protein
MDETLAGGGDFIRKSAKIVRRDCGGCQDDETAISDWVHILARFLGVGISAEDELPGEAWRGELVSTPQGCLRGRPPYFVYRTRFPRVRCPQNSVRT